VSPRTQYLSRLIGLYCLLVGLAMSLNKQAAVERVTAFVHNAPAVMFASTLAVIGGLALVLGHNVWSGGLQPVLVTIFGWVLLIKGLVFLFLTPQANVRFFEAAHYDQLFYLYVSIELVIGVILTYAGFRPAAITHATGDRPVHATQ